MTVQHTSHRRRAVLRRAGFTLIELMIVVTITGILAAVATPVFTSYVQKSRTSEAVQFLGVIKLRQESYRAEFGQYLQYNGNADVTAITYIPANAATMKNAVSVAFPATNTWFDQLGARPDGPVRFGYGWAAGLPGTEPAVLGLPGPDHWFMAQGVTDLDGDGLVLTIELTSHTRSVWLGVGGADCTAGWE
jgi:prepilin-type N-terminal cleavage/methylation domain-containing protein